MSVLRGHRRPGKKWTPLDRLILTALQAYEDDLCPGCGQPRTYAMDPSARGRYNAPSVICHGCAAKQRADAPVKKPTPGQYRHAVPDHAMQYAMAHPTHVHQPPTA